VDEMDDNEIIIDSEYPDDDGVDDVITEACSTNKHSQCDDEEDCDCECHMVEAS
jgi:hypothetical protein